MGSALSCPGAARKGTRLALAFYWRGWYTAQVGQMRLLMVTGEQGDTGLAKEVLFLVEDADEGGYTARALGYSIYAEAGS